MIKNSIPNINILNNKSILITGSTGLIGSALIDMIIYLNIFFKSNIHIYAAGRDKNKIKPISFEDCVNDICVNNGKDVIKMEDVLPSKEIDTVEAIIRGEEVEALHKAINKLSEREQYIIRKFYGIGKTEELDYNYYFADYFGTNNPTLVQREIAEKINTSRSYIYQCGC